MTLDGASDGMISCRLLRSVLVCFAELYGQSRLEGVLRAEPLPGGLSYDALRNEDNWIPVTTAEWLISTLANAAPEPNFPRLAGRRTVSPDMLGRGYTFLRAFGNPMLCYRKSVEFAQVYNHGAAYGFKKLGRRSVEITYKSHTVEPNRHPCELRLGQYETLPTIWGLRPADAHEVECQVRGASACRYKLQWVERPRARLSIAAAAVVAGATFALHALLPGLDYSPWIAVAAVVCAALLSLLGSSMRTIRDLEDTLAQHNYDFAAMLGKLRDANAELEDRVSLRTAELKEKTELLQVALKEAERSAADARETRAVLDERTTRLAAVGQGASQIAHDMRSPLQGILGHADMCAMALERFDAGAPADEIGALRAKLDRSLGFITQAAHRGDQMMNNILSFIRSGAENFDKQRNDIGQLLRDIAGSMSPELRASSIELQLSVDGGDLSLWCDTLQLRRAIENLLRNSREALASARNPQAQQGKKLWLKVWPERESIVIKVADNGDGIPDDVKERLGRPFATSGKASGTGLGLAVTWNIITAHDGRIEVESHAPEGGASFVITMPRVAATAVGNSQ